MEVDQACYEDFLPRQNTWHHKQQYDILSYCLWYDLSDQICSWCWVQQWGDRSLRWNLYRKRTHLPLLDQPNPKNKDEQQTKLVWALTLGRRIILTYLSPASIGSMKRKTAIQKIISHFQATSLEDTLRFRVSWLNIKVTWPLYWELSQLWRVWDLLTVACPPPH